jgi:hypothetical protein
MRRMIGLIGVCSALAGCGTISTTSVVDKFETGTFNLEKANTPNKSPAELSLEDQKQLEEKLKEVLNFCLPRLSGYEKASAAQARNAYWLSMSGLIAGSVLGPALVAANAAANAGAIAALSGWAGATNFAGQALKSSGLSGSAIAETRNGIIKSVRDSIAIASDGSKAFEERRSALMKARADCIIYEIAVPSVPQAN